MLVTGKRQQLVVEKLQSIKVIEGALARLSAKRRVLIGVSDSVAPLPAVFTASRDL